MGLKDFWSAFSRALEPQAPVQPRSHDRVTTRAIPVYVTWRFGGKAAGVMCDLSATGIGLKLKEKVPRSERVRIDLNGSAVFGRVRYCRRDADGEYLTGFVIE
jgi:hypothetical protein